MTPKVSILIPVYNRNSYISECIQSALDQTFTDFEIVIVDNASDDGTWEICQQFAAKNSRIRIFRNEQNIGPVRNWMKCAHLAKGEYSKILFSDDIIEKDCVELMVNAIESEKGVAFVFSSVMIGENIKTAQAFYNAIDDRKLSKNQIQLGIVYGLVPLSPGAMLFRTNELKDNILVDIPSIEPQRFSMHGAGPDVLIALRIISKYPCAKCLGKPLAFFRQHSGSFTVENKNNEIKNSYAAAISYQLKIDNGLAWSAHLGKRIISRLLSGCKIDDLKNYSRMLGAKGNLSELILSALIFVALRSTSLIWSKFSRR